MRGERFIGKRAGLLLFLVAKALYVDGLHFLLAFYHGRFVELLTGAELFHRAGLVEFSFETFEGSFDRLSFFYGNNKHWFIVFFVNNCFIESLSQKPSPTGNALLPTV